jgi:hypothetical protein
MNQNYEVRCDDDWSFLCITLMSMYNQKVSFVTTCDLFIPTDSWRRRVIVFTYATLLRVRSQYTYLCPNKDRLNYSASIMTLQGKECCTHVTYVAVLFDHTAIKSDAAPSVYEPGIN